MPGLRVRALGGSCERDGSGETWVGNVKVLWCIFASFWLSWAAFWPHFGCLGALLGLILGLLDPLEAPFWPKLGQVGPR